MIELLDKATLDFIAPVDREVERVEGEEIEQVISSLLLEATQAGTFFVLA